MCCDSTGYQKITDYSECLYAHFPVFGRLGSIPDYLLTIVNVTGYAAHHAVADYSERAGSADISALITVNTGI